MDFIHYITFSAFHCAASKKTWNKTFTNFVLKTIRRNLDDYRSMARGVMGTTSVLRSFKRVIASLFTKLAFNIFIWKKEKNIYLTETVQSSARRKKLIITSILISTSWISILSKHQLRKKRKEYSTDFINSIITYPRCFCYKNNYSFPKMPYYCSNFVFMLALNWWYT